jgi:hypothetical protein
VPSETITAVRAGYATGDETIDALVGFTRTGSRAEQVIELLLG